MSNYKLINGIIIRSISGFYYVKTEYGIFECKGRGILRKKNIVPYVGDNVIIQYDSIGKGIINEIIDRKNILIRPSIANVDNLILVVATCYPKPDLFNVDTLIAIAELIGINVVILITKIDLYERKDILLVYQSCGYKVFEVDNKSLSENQLNQLTEIMKGKVNVLCGNTGAGKSSFLNSLDNSLNLKTSKVSEKLGRGKHTTRCAEIYSVEGNIYIADTPGFSSIDFSFYNFIDCNLDSLFVEFLPYINQCKFSDCKHISESKCKILDMVENGNIEISRYNSYKKLYLDIETLKKNYRR